METTASSAAPSAPVVLLPLSARHPVAWLASGARDRCLLLSDYAGQGMREVPDPYTGGDREFDHAWDLVDGMARDIVRKLA